MGQPIPATVHKLELNFEGITATNHANVTILYSTDDAPNSLQSAYEPDLDIDDVASVLTDFAQGHGLTFTQMQLQ